MANAKDEVGMVKGEACRGMRSFPFLVVALFILLLLGWRGIRWGLPSEERNRLYFTDGVVRVPKLSEAEIKKSWQDYPDFVRGTVRKGKLPRSVFNPIRSYHPDEYVILKSLASMDPKRLKLFPGFFGWPAFYFYCVGAVLQAGSWLGVVHLARDIGHYYHHPEEIARMYLAGRWLTLAFALGAVAVFYFALKRLHDKPTAGFAALLLAVCPLFTINARYMTADVPMLFWIAVALYFSVRIFQQGDRKWYVLAGCAIGLSASTRYQGCLAAFLVLAAHLLHEKKESDAEAAKPSFAARVLRADIWIAGGCAILVFVVLNPYIVLKFGQFWRELTGEVAGSRGGVVSVLRDPFFFAESALGLLTVVSTAAGLVWMCVRRERADWLVLFGFAPALLLLAAQRPAMVRYYMPVLFLPVVLSARVLLAWREHARGVARVALGVLTAAVAAECLARSVVYADLSCDKDTRTRAAEWISVNVPRRGTIGMVSEPWQFEAPPIDMGRYAVRIVGTDLDKLRKVRPKYFVCSSLQVPPLAVRGPLSEEEEAFWRVIRSEGYERMQVFRRTRPVLFGSGPHDAHYVSPEISIYRAR